jgi:hypothetical protein
MMVLLMLMCVAPLPGGEMPTTERPTREEVTSPLSQTLDALERDATAILNPALSPSERTQLALEIRTQGDRVRALTSNKPPAFMKLGFDVEKRTARVVDALGRGDRDALSREAGALSVQIHALRAAMATP